MTAVAVRIEGVSKRFGKVQALREVSFEVPERSIFGLVGPNGAGKTTLFSVIAHFIKANAGRVEVLGIETREISRLKGRLTIFPQDAQFQRNVPILEQLAFFRQLDGRGRAVAKAEVLETLALVGLEEVAGRRAGALSHGMVKRLGIAQAFLGHPEVILLDEPTAGLDPANARSLRDLIKRLQERATVVVSSHNLAEVQELCDHVAILDRGRLVLADSMARIVAPGREYELMLARGLTQEEQAGLAEIAGVRAVEPVATNGAGREGAAYRAQLDLTGGADEDAVVGALLGRLIELGATPRRFGEGRSFEARFLEITGGSGES